GDEVEDPTTGLTELRRDAAGRDLDFLQGVVVDLADEVADGGVLHLEAVHAVVVRSDVAPLHRIDRRKRVRALVDARLKVQDVRKAPTGREIQQRRLVDV